MALFVNFKKMYKIQPIRVLIAESRNFELLRAHLKRELAVVAIKPGNKQNKKED